MKSSYELNEKEDEKDETNKINRENNENTSTLFLTYMIIFKISIETYEKTIFTQ